MSDDAKLISRGSLLTGIFECTSSISMNKIAKNNPDMNEKKIAKIITIHNQVKENSKVHSRENYLYINITQ